MKMIIRSTLALFALAPITLFGHHSSIGRYDPNDFMEIEGEVTKVQWGNPHVYLAVEVIDPAGTLVSWELEADSATRLIRSGILPDAIQVGDYIRAGGEPPLTAKKEMFVMNILIPSGVELLMRADAERKWAANAEGDFSFRYVTEGSSSNPELGVFRVWATTAADPRLMHRVETRADLAASYPLTEAGLLVFQRFNPATDNPTQNCMPKGMPLIMDQPYPMKFVQEGNNIVLRIEEYDTVRMIHMDRETAPVDEPATILGYSIGRWEEATLVVTTSKLNYPWVSQLGVPQSENSVLVERFSPAEDGSQLHYEITITDPVYFTEPVILDKDFLYLPGIEVQDFNCAE